MSLVESREAAPAWKQRVAVSARNYDRQSELPLTKGLRRTDDDPQPIVADQANQPGERVDESDDALPVLLVASNSHRLAHFRDLIAKGGYRVVSAASGKEAIRLLQREVFSLTVIHEVDDFPPSKLSRVVKMRVQQELRPELPVVLLASTFDSDYAVRCLRAGSDDYITGPHLEPRVLLARLEAVLRSYRRRSDEKSHEQKATIKVGDLMLDPARFRVEVQGKPLELTKIQFNLLYALAQRPGRVFTRSQLRGVVAEHGGNPEDNSIKSHIYHLRQRLGGSGRQIETARGVGYRLVE
jgi:two-component system, OmpR family, alkaline phosphatase synthesis response regulator PhoP